MPCGIRLGFENTTNAGVKRDAIWKALGEKKSPPSCYRFTRLIWIDSFRPVRDPSVIPLDRPHQSINNRLGRKRLAASPTAADQHATSSLNMKYRNMAIYNGSNPIAQSYNASHCSQTWKEHSESLSPKWPLRSIQFESFLQLPVLSVAGHV